MVKDVKMETQYGFVLRDSLQQAAAGTPVFAGKSFYLTAGVQPSVQDIADLVTSGGSFLLWVGGVFSPTIITFVLCCFH